MGGDWFSPPPPFISPYAFSSITGAAGGYLTDPTAAFSGYGLGGFGGVNNPLSPLTGIFGGGPAGLGGGGPGGGMTGLGGMPSGQPGYTGNPGMVEGAGGPGPDGVMNEAFGFGASGPLNPQRQGSLSQEQQMELMDVLETEGMGDIDTFLNMGIGLGGVSGGPPGGVNW